MHYLRARFGGCVVGLLALLCVIPADGQEAVSLAPRYEADGKWFIHATSRFELDLATEDAEGKRTAHSVVQTREDKYTREFVEVGDHGPVRQNLTYLMSRELVVRDPQLPPQGGRTELEDRVFLVQSRPDGQSVSCQNGQVEEKWLRQVIAKEGVLALLPDRPVPAGESWTVEGADACRFLVETFSILPDADSQVVCTLTRVREEGGARLAEINVSMTLKGKSKGEGGGPGYELSLSMTGELLFDLGAGRPRSMVLDGSMKMNGARSSETGETLLKVDGAANVKCEIVFE